VLATESNAGTRVSRVSPNLGSLSLSTLTWTVAWVVVLVLGAFQAVGTRFEMNPDGISYLNLSDLYVRGEWSAAINGYWSPAYPALIGFFRRLLQPSLYWEASAVHFLNFLLYVVTFASFQLFLRELGRAQLERQNQAARDVLFITFRRPLEIAFAVSLFVWGALTLTSVGNVGPDMMLAGIVFCVATVLLRIRYRTFSRSSFLLLGALLGLGYLTKAVMFPMGCLIALTCAIGPGRRRTWLLGTTLSAAAFLAVASPQVVAMSRLTGQPTYGPVGAISYAGKVNWYTRWWIGEPGGSGIPKHPIRRFYFHPDAYEFASSRPSSSYPFWDDPAYWLAGIRPHFSVREQLPVIEFFLRKYARVFGSLVLAYVALVLVTGPGRRVRFPYLIFPAAAVFALYGLVHAEERFFGAWSVVLFCSALSGLTFPETSKRRVYVVLGLLALIKLVPIGKESILRARQVAGVFTGYTEDHMAWNVASNLHKFGVPPGVRVGTIGRAFDGYWARLAKVQIAMEINEYQAPFYWEATDSAKADIRKSFAAMGARAIVMNRVPPDYVRPGWANLGGGYYAEILEQTSKDPLSLLTPTKR
jgi:hypothetical protein